MVFLKRKVWLYKILIRKITMKDLPSDLVRPISNKTEYLKSPRTRRYSSRMVFKNNILNLFLIFFPSLPTDKFKPPQIHISPGSEDIRFDELLPMQQPVVQIMVDSPKEPPRGDFSNEYPEISAHVYDYYPPKSEELVTEETSMAPTVEISPPTPIDLNAPIDVNIQGDTSKVFYDYNPQDANEIIVLETLTEESPKSEDLPLPQAVLPALPTATTSPCITAIATAATPTTTATPTDIYESSTASESGSPDEGDKAVR